MKPKYCKSIEACLLDVCTPDYFLRSSAEKVISIYVNKREELDTFGVRVIDTFMDDPGSFFVAVEEVREKVESAVEALVNRLKSRGKDPFHYAPTFEEDRKRGRIGSIHAYIGFYASEEEDAD